MKKSIKQLVLLSIIAFLFICGTPCFAQFLPANTITDWWGETDPNYTIQSIGIGEFFTNGDHPKAALDIKIPYLQPAPLTSWSPGEAIHSTVASDYDPAMPDISLLIIY